MTQTSEEDILLADVVNDYFGHPAFKQFVDSIERINSNQYIFGTTKLHLKCVNGYLIGNHPVLSSDLIASTARIGGGWMRLDDFLRRHLDSLVRIVVPDHQ